MAGIQFTKEIDDELIAASIKYNIPVNTLKTIAWLESSGDPNAKNPSSSAGGLFQFIDKTAEGYNVKDRFDFKEAIDKGGKLTANNRAILKKALGREPTGSELYLAHQQGATGAVRLLKNPDLNVLKVKGMDKDKVVKNAGNVKMTAGEFANMWTDKADALSSAFPATPSYRNLETNPFPVTRRENTAVETSIRPQARPSVREVPAMAQPLAIEQAVMEASATPVPPPSQPAIQQVPLRPTGGVIPLKLDEFNQGTSEVMPRRYADGTAEVIPEWLRSYSEDVQNAYLRRQNTIQERDTNIEIAKQKENDFNSYPIVDLKATGPVPGDMRGSPQGFAGLSDQQISQSFKEMNADRSAFNPVVPPYVPQPGDMLGYPKGQFRNSLGQMVQAAQEKRADMSAFNPVVPPLVPNSALPTVPAGFAGDQAPMGEGLDLTEMSMNDLQVLSKRSPSLVPIIRQEIDRRNTNTAGRNMDVSMGDDGRERVPSNYIADPRVKPYLQPGMTYTVDGNQVRYDPTVPSLVNTNTETTLVPPSVPLPEAANQDVFTPNPYQESSLFQNTPEGYVHTPSGLNVEEMSEDQLNMLSNGDTSDAVIAQQELSKRNKAKAEIILSENQAILDSGGVLTAAQEKAFQKAKEQASSSDEALSAITKSRQDAVSNREIVEQAQVDAWARESQRYIDNLKQQGYDTAAAELERNKKLEELNSQAAQDNAANTVVDPYANGVPPVVEQDPAKPEVPVETTDSKTEKLGSTNGAGLSTDNEGRVVGPNGVVIKELTPAQAEAAANAAGLDTGDLLSKLGPIFKALFGLETQDMTRALGFYLMSRASGASHAGSMRWAGGTVLKQAEARNIRNSSRADAAAKAFTAIAGNYTKSAASKIRSALAKGNIVEAQALMDDANSKTVRGKLGIDPNATGTFYMMPGYTKAVEVFEGTGGNRYTKVTTTEDGKTVEKYIPISSQQMGELRERGAQDDAQSRISAVRAYVEQMPPALFKREGVDDKGETYREAGIFSGRNQEGVTADIMAFSKKQRELGLPDDPLQLMMMVGRGAELAEAMGVTKINAETILNMQIVGGDILFDQGKISKDGELVPASKIKSFTTDFQDILGNDRKKINSAMNDAASSWTPTTTIENVKDSTNYNGLTSEQKAKVDSAPSSFMALSLTIAYQYKNKNENET